MTTETGAVQASGFSRLIASPWTAIIAVVVALAIVATGIVLVTKDRAAPVPAAAPAPGERAPSDFDLSATALSSPFVHRGEPVSIELAAAPGVDVVRVEVWQDGEPYFELEDVALVTDPDTGTMRFALDVVPVTAGAHLITARAYDAQGRMAQTVPIAVPVLDLPDDLGVTTATSTTAASTTALSMPGMRFQAAPGDTLQVIADRLGVDAKTLTVADGTVDSAKKLGAGLVITGTVPRVEDLKPSHVFDTKADTDIKATLDGCAVVVTSATDADLRVYGGAGMVALGDLPRGGELRLTSLPVGPTLLAAYAAAEAQNKVPPSAPVTVTIPDECARDAWTGNAYITGGIMLTDDAVTQPYAYVAVDKGEWRRVPAADGTYLNGSSTIVSDLRSYLDLSHYDQIDLEVWSGADASGPAAAGQYCRKDTNHSEPGASSASGGECTPAAAAPSGAPGTSPSKPITLTLHSKAAAPILVKTVDIDPQPGDNEQWQQTGSAEVGFGTDAAQQGYGTVMYQFSLIPFSPASTGINPPGMFFSTVGAADVDPWKWHGAVVHEDALDDVDNLSLDDQVALDLLKARIAQGANLIDTVYVRAIAVEPVPQTGTYVSLGVSSNTIEIMMPTGLEGKWPQIEDASITVKPGRDITGITGAYAHPDKANNPASVRGVESTCHEVSQYPAEDAYTVYPWAAPTWRSLSGTTYQAGSPRLWTDQKVKDATGPSDLTTAKLTWPRDDVIYCLDIDANQKRLDEANNYEPPTCGFGCALTFVVYGALQGFVVGGPTGALVGALIGLGVGLGAAVDPVFYAAVMTAWDKVASLYNGVFNVAFTVIEAVNPACQSAKALGSSAQKFCNESFRSVGEAAVTYYTGAPPQLASSAELRASAEGDMNTLIQLGLDSALKQLGLSCATFTMDSGEVNATLDAAANYGATTPDLSELKNSAGDFSGCATLAGVMSKTIAAAADDRQAAVMSAITGKSSVPGLIISPVADERPTVVFSGTPTATPGSAQTCPALVNAEITEGGVTSRLYPVHSIVWLKYGKTDPDGVTTPSAWTGQIAVPAERNASYLDKPSKAVMETVPAVAGAPYLHVTVTAPCFDAALELKASKYSLFGSQGAFTVDPRPLVAYH